MPEHEGQGEIAIPKDIKREKEKRFFENPDGFIEISELVIGAMVSEKGIQILFNPATCKRSQMLQIKGEIDHRITSALIEIDVAREMNKRIVNPNKGGMMRFARKRFK